MTDEKTLHGTGKRVENASERITLQTENNAESTGAHNAYIYLSMDAQLNIQNEAFVSAIIRKMLTMLEPHTALFVAPTGVGKTHLALDLLEQAYINHLHFIVITCSTLKHNKTYKSRKWVWTDPYTIPIEPDNRLYDWIEKIGDLLAGSKILFLIDDIIADETLDKRRQPLLQFAISGRRKSHSLWLLCNPTLLLP